MSFDILNQPNYDLAKEVTSIEGSETVERIKKLLEENKIVLLMKGNATAPMCGFSANTAAILLSYGKEFHTFNILSDEAIRQGVKEYSNWPTFPQLYVNGKLVGGNDIITELHQDEELADVLNG
jgi:monothiol glutaredoxin